MSKNNDYTIKNSKKNLRGKREENIMNTKYKIKGLDCANCAAELERAIQKVEGIEEVNINFIVERMELKYDENNEEEIMKKVKKVIKREEPDVIIEKI